MLETSTKTGYITQIIGPVLDVVFPSGNLPKIYHRSVDKYFHKYQVIIQ